MTVNGAKMHVDACLRLCFVIFLVFACSPVGGPAWEQALTARIHASTGQRRRPPRRAGSAGPCRHLHDGNLSAYGQSQRNRRAQPIRNLVKTGEALVFEASRQRPMRSPPGFRCTIQRPTPCPLSLFSAILRMQSRCVSITLISWPFAPRQPHGKTVSLTAAANFATA